MADQTQILTLGLHTTFASLRHSNFRIYFAAQIGSNIGSWIQITAENWLVLQLAHSGLALGTFAPAPQRRLPVISRSTKIGNDSLRKLAGLTGWPSRPASCSHGEAA
jgi:hypothetical protein